MKKSGTLKQMQTTAPPSDSDSKWMLFHTKKKKNRTVMVIESSLFDFTINQSNFDKLARNLPSPDSTNVDQAYQDFCNTISKAAKKSIPRGRRNTYIPCWDAKCEALYQTFPQSPAGDQSSRAATAFII